jgi:Peptidase M50B-like
MAFGSDVSRVWTSVTETQPTPNSRVIAICGAIAFAMVAWAPAWHYTRHLVTICHEGAHGVAALLSGRRLAGIRLHSDTSGLTLSRGRNTGVGMFITAAAGYLGPALVGLAAAYLLHVNHAVALLWGAIVLLALLLVQIRNWFGLWSVLVAAGAVFAVSWWAPAQWQSGFAYVVAWFLLLAAPRAVFELQGSRRRGQARGSDADLLARMTRLPPVLWVGLLLVATLAALAVGTVWIVDRNPF